MLGDHLMCRLTRTQNRNLSFKCITHNVHKLTNLAISMTYSTKPLFHILNLIIMANYCKLYVIPVLAIPTFTS